MLQKLILNSFTLRLSFFSLYLELEWSVSFVSLQLLNKTKFDEDGEEIKGNIICFKMAHLKRMFLYNQSREFSPHCKFYSFPFKTNLWRLRSVKLLQFALLKLFVRQSYLFKYKIFYPQALLFPFKISHWIISAK